MSFAERIAPLLGRLAIAWYLVTRALDYAGNWHGTMTLMVEHRIPVPQLLLLLALLLVFLGVASLVLGFHIQHGAMALFAFMLLVALFIHNFWTIADPALRAAARQLFARDILLMGALLLVVGQGPGRFAIDNAGKGGRKKGG
jgi:putative oxidoreductase